MKTSKEKKVDGKYVERTDNGALDSKGKNYILFYLKKRNIDKGCSGSSETILRCIFLTFNKIKLFETFLDYCTYVVLLNYKVWDL